jgi:biotin synthase
MGEAPRHRAELAIELRALDVDEVPSISSSASKAPAMAGRDPLAPIEMLRIIACFRLAYPARTSSSPRAATTSASSSR